MDANFHLSLINTEGLRAQTFEYKILEMIENIQSALYDVANRVDTLESAIALSDQVAIDNLKSDIQLVANDVTNLSTLNQAEIAVLNQKIDGCSWCASGKLGANSP